MKILINEQQYKNLIDEEKFTIHDLTPEEKENVYKIFTDSYTDSVGTSWSKDKFFNRADNWFFYGVKDKGFVTVRKQRTGSNKLTGVAGDLKSIKLGIDELINTNEPIWGMADTKITNILNKKFGFIVPPANIMKILLPTIPKTVFGGADYTINDDGSLTFHYEDVGDATKYFFGNKKYFEMTRFFIEINKHISDNQKYEVNNYLNTVL